ncbi:hypothetical protein [Azohydromonas aeria]|uniref:hypothetical protein n=1 Tax=Azohydromonas aeria TaxID=2590212 RepID=UPI0012FB9ABC|nr:hypothetical protein [Azohydromonas aeria]
MELQKAEWETAKYGCRHRRVGSWAMELPVKQATGSSKPVLEEVQEKLTAAQEYDSVSVGMPAVW